MTCIHTPQGGSVALAYPIDIYNHIYTEYELSFSILGSRIQWASINLAMKHPLPSGKRTNNGSQNINYVVAH